MRIYRVTEETTRTVYMEGLQTTSAVLHSCSLSLRAVKMEVPKDHRARFLKEQPLGPEVLIGKREPLRNHPQEKEARSGMGWDKHRRNARRAAPVPFFRGCLRRPDLLPCKSASVVGKKHKERAWREASGEKGNEGTPLLLRAFNFETRPYLRIRE